MTAGQTGMPNVSIPQMWCLGTRLSGGRGRAGVLNDLKGLSQPKRIYKRTSVNRTALLIGTGPSVILCLILF